MTEITHSFGPTCALFEEPQHAVDEEHRPVKAQFFYVSSLPIDDPLSPLPPISADKAVNLPPQPFSIRDNAALEEAWTAFQEAGTSNSKSGHARGTAQPSRGISALRKFRNVSSFSLGRSPNSEERGSDVSEGSNIWRRRKQQKLESPVMLDENQDSRATSPRLIDPEELQCEDPDHQTRPVEESRSRHRRFSPFRRRSKSKEREANQDHAPKSDMPELSTSAASATFAGTSSDMSGRPFARAPSGRNIASKFADTPGHLPLSSDDSADEFKPDHSRSHSSSRHHHSKTQDKQKKIR